MRRSHGWLNWIGKSGHLNSFRVGLFLFVIFIVFYILNVLLFESINRSLSETYMTLVTNDDYVESVKVLSQSLKENNATRSLVVLVTAGVSETNIKELKRLGCIIKTVEPIGNPTQSTITAENSRWLDTYTKLRVWEQVEYDVVVFLDADCLVVKNIDDLFDPSLHTRWKRSRPEKYQKKVKFLASPECCDRFNSGVFVTNPNYETFKDMMEQLFTDTGHPNMDSYDGGDQGFLNSYFEQTWEQLPFYYNAIQNRYFEPEDRNAWKMDEIRVLHFVKYKPWQLSSQPQSQAEAARMQLGTLQEKWWQVHKRMMDVIK